GGFTQSTIHLKSNDSFLFGWHCGFRCWWQRVRGWQIFFLLGRRRWDCFAIDRLNRRKWGENALLIRKSAGQANLPATTQSAIDLDQPLRDLPAGLHPKILLLNQR